MNKHITKIIAVAFLFLAFAFSHSAHAAPTDNVFGTASSANIGNISFNNCATIPSASCAGVPYGVKIDTFNNVSGYAWSPSVGWISFNASQLASCPTLPCTATYNSTTGALTGWAKACGGKIASGAQTTDINNVCSGANRTDLSDMWISLGGSATNGNPYGVNLSKTTGLGSGYAWGSDVIGWVNFSNVKIEPLSVNGVCAAPPHGGTYSTAPTGTLCSAGTAVPATLSGSGPWTWSCNGSSGGTNASCSASAATVPLVTTNAATSVTTTSAVINGYVNVNGSTNVPLVLTMEYSLNSNMSGYGSLNSNNSPTSVSTNIAPIQGALVGLTPNTTYYFRAVATYGGSTRYTGSILSFTTGAVGNPIVTTNAATSITTTSAYISGSLNVNGSTNVPLVLTMEWSPNSNMSGNGVLFCNGSPTSTSGPINPFVALQGLNPNTTYYARAVATYGGSIRYTGAIVPFTTLSNTPSVTLSANPTSLSAGGGSTTLTWTSNLVSSCKTTSNPVASGWDSNNKSLSGSQNISITNSTTFGISCDNGAVSAQASVTVGGVTPPAGPIPPKKPKWWEF